MKGFALVTGATGGLGKEFCRQLSAKGENLFLTGRSEEKLALLKSELLSKGGGEILYFPADISSEKDRENLFKYIDEKGIKLSALYNVAGVDTQKPFEDYSEEKLIFQCRVNLEATLSVTRYSLSRRTKDFKILTVASMSGSVPMPYFAIYSATKAALINFFTSLRYECKDCKITTLAPGGIPTREDIIEDIKIQGLKGKLSSKPAEFVVKKALVALDRNKRLEIPGAFNKFVYFIEKITPLGVQCRFVAKNWKNKSKDAF